MGVYISSVLKDLICAPRPYVPPVTRLCMYALFDFLHEAHEFHSDRISSQGVRLLVYPLYEQCLSRALHLPPPPHESHRLHNNLCPLMRHPCHLHLLHRLWSTLLRHALLRGLRRRRASRRIRHGHLVGLWRYDGMVVEDCGLESTVDVDPARFVDDQSTSATS